MIIKKHRNIFVYFILLLGSSIVFLITVPFGVLYGIIYMGYTKLIKGLGLYFLEIAIGIDHLGNIMMQHLFNQILIKKNGYPFGFKFETISSVLGKNLERNTLKICGRILNYILNLMDKNHSLNSIKYYIEIKVDK